MNTENIIENLMNGNIAAAKEETEDILYSKIGEAINFIKDDVTDGVYGLSEDKKKKKSEEDEIIFAPSTELEDDGEGMDPVDAEDSDIDNDGDSDESDEYLKNRRKVRKKAIGESEEIDEWVAPVLRGIAAVAKPVGKAVVGLAKTETGKKIGKEVVKSKVRDMVNSGIDKVKNRNQGASNIQTEGAGGDDRKEFIYGMKISRYEKLSDKQKAHVKQSWYSDKAKEEKRKGKN
jgi:hypothetical protein